MLGSGPLVLETLASGPLCSLGSLLALGWPLGSLLALGWPLGSPLGMEFTRRLG
jgi:hypothetical protein